MHPIPLYPDMKIGQMIFHTMAGLPDRTYAATGRYNAHLSVHPSLG
jgi:deoxycytidine triphosphate deaminase